MSIRNVPQEVWDMILPDLSLTDIKHLRQTGRFLMKITAERFRKSLNLERGVVSTRNGLQALQAISKSAYVQSLFTDLTLVVLLPCYGSTWTLQDGDPFLDHVVIAQDGNTRLLYESLGRLSNVRTVRVVAVFYDNSDRGSQQALSLRFNVPNWIRIHPLIWRAVGKIGGLTIEDREPFESPETPASYFAHLRHVYRDFLSPVIVSVIKALDFAEIKPRAFHVTVAGAYNGAMWNPELLNAFNVPALKGVREFGFMFSELRNHPHPSEQEVISTGSNAVPLRDQDIGLRIFLQRIPHVQDVSVHIPSNRFTGIDLENALPCRWFGTIRLSDVHVDVQRLLEHIRSCKDNFDRLTLARVLLSRTDPTKQRSARWLSIARLKRSVVYRVDFWQSETNSFKGPFGEMIEQLEQWIEVYLNGGNE